jgi:hypothetical protein
MLQIDGLVKRGRFFCLPLHSVHLSISCEKHRSGLVSKVQAAVLGTIHPALDVVAVSAVIKGRKKQDCIYGGIPTMRILSQKNVGQ